MTGEPPRLHPHADREAYLAVAWEQRVEPQVPVLRTERLVLRGWEPVDRAPFAELNADPEVMAHLPALLSRGASNRLVAGIRQHFLEHGYGLWAVQAPEGFVGFAGLQWTEVTGTPELEVGWRLARSAWGRGYATEAGRAALAYGLERVPDLARVIAVTAVTNRRSVAVMERIGMRRQHEFDHPRDDLPDRLRRHVLFAADREPIRSGV